MATKNITIRVSEDTFEFLSTEFNTATAGATECVDLVCEIAKQSGTNSNNLVNSMMYLQQIRAYSMRELKGTFSANEWKYLADVLNGTMITPEFRCNKSALMAAVEDGNDFDGLSQKWDVDVAAFCGKIKGLTGAQIDAVYTNVEKFWAKPDDLNAWSASL